MLENNGEKNSHDLIKIGSKDKCHIFVIIKTLQNGSSKHFKKEQKLIKRMKRIFTTGKKEKKLNFY